MEGVTMNDDDVPEATRQEELRLIRAFLRLRNPGRRQRVLELAERLAEERWVAEGPAVPTHHSSSQLETSPGQAE